MRVFEAIDEANKHMEVYCDVAEVSGECRAALLPEQPHKEADGWIERYAFSRKGAVLLDDAGEHIVIRQHGRVWWCWEDGYQIPSERRARHWVDTGIMIRPETVAP